MHVESVVFLCGVSGSLKSCDSFLAAFESEGLRHGAICPCVWCMLKAVSH